MSLKLLVKSRPLCVCAGLDDYTPQRRRGRREFQALLQLHVVDSHLACLDTMDELDQVWILYFQCITDQRSRLHWY